MKKVEELQFRHLWQHFFGVYNFKKQHSNAKVFEKDWGKLDVEVNIIV